jgi:hypothetical protein
LTGGPDSPQSRRLFGREHESCNDPRRFSFSHPFAELVMPTATVPRTDSHQTELQQTLERLAADIRVRHRDVLRELRLEFVEGGLILRAARPASLANSSPSTRRNTTHG